MLDLTAGDGRTAPGSFTEDCSPGIAINKINWLLGREPRKSIDYVGIEKQAQTYSNLVKNCDRYLGPAWKRSREDGKYVGRCENGRILLLNGNSQNFRLPAWMTTPNCALFVYNDPNHIEDWCISDQLLKTAPEYTTSLSTLGCNVNGLKRMKLDKRALWYERIELVNQSLMQHWHDSCLFSVGGCDQWAYLITAPMKWRDRVTKECLLAAKKLKDRTAEPRIAWYKESLDDFRRLQDYLFLTKKENAGVA